MGAMGEHHASSGRKEEWLTPPYLLKLLGKFDLDPCACSGRRPWDTAANHITLPDDGLKKPWQGRVWLNPPYGKKTEEWIARLADHGDGIALIFARTETAFFFESIWDKADAVLFIKGRLTFYHANGCMAIGNAGAPSCLVAYGAHNVQWLLAIEAKLGKVVKLK